MRSVGVLADDGDASVAEVDPGIDDDACTRLVGVAAHDDAGPVGAEDSRFRHRGKAFADPDVEVVERRSAELDQHLVGARLGIRRVLVAKHLRPAVGVDSYGFHVTIRP